MENDKILKSSFILCIFLISLASIPSTTLIQQNKKENSMQRDFSFSDLKQNGCECPSNFSVLFDLLNSSLGGFNNTCIDRMLAVLPNFDLYSVTNDDFQDLLLSEELLGDLVAYSIERGYINCLGKFILNNSIFLGVRTSGLNDSLIMIICSLSSLNLGNEPIGCIISNTERGFHFFNRHSSIEWIFERMNESVDDLKYKFEVVVHANSSSFSDWMACLGIYWALSELGTICGIAIGACIVSEFNGYVCTATAIICAAFFVIYGIVCSQETEDPNPPYNESSYALSLISTSTYNYYDSNSILVETNDSLTFDASNSYDDNDWSVHDEENDVTYVYSDIVSYCWDFGDGTTSDEIIAEHSYSNEGVYIVTLTVTDRWGFEDTKSIVITVCDDITPPEITITIDQYKLNANGGIDVFFSIQAEDPESGLDLESVEILIDGHKFVNLGSNNITFHKLESYVLSVTVSNTNQISGTKSITVNIDEILVKSLVLIEIDTFRAVLTESDESCWDNPARNRMNTMMNKMDSLIELVNAGNYSEAYDKLLHDIKPKVTGVKTDENELIWGNGVYNNPWILDSLLQSECLLVCNTILHGLKLILTNPSSQEPVDSLDSRNSTIASFTISGFVTCALFCCCMLIQVKRKRNNRQVGIIRI